MALAKGQKGEEVSVYLDCLKPGPDEVKPLCDPKNSRCCVGLDCFVQEKGDKPRCGNRFENPYFKKWGVDDQPHFKLMANALAPSGSHSLLALLVVLGLAGLSFVLMNQLHRWWSRRRDGSPYAQI